MSNSHNAYLNGSGQLGPASGTDVVLTNFVYARGPLGDFYQVLHERAGGVVHPDAPNNCFIRRRDCGFLCALEFTFWRVPFKLKLEFQRAGSETGAPNRTVYNLWIHCRLFY